MEVVVVKGRRQGARGELWRRMVPCIMSNTVRSSGLRVKVRNTYQRGPLLIQVLAYS